MSKRIFGLRNLTGKHSKPCLYIGNERAYIDDIAVARSFAVIQNLGCQRHHRHRCLTLRVSGGQGLFGELQRCLTGPETRASGAVSAASTPGAATCRISSGDSFLVWEAISRLM